MLLELSAESLTHVFGCLWTLYLQLVLCKFTEISSRITDTNVKEDLNEYNFCLQGQQK